MSLVEKTARPTKRSFRCTEPVLVKEFADTAIVVFQRRFAHRKGLTVLQHDPFLLLALFGKLLFEMRRLKPHHHPHGS